MNLAASGHISKRALRRHHRARMIAHPRGVIQIQGWVDFFRPDEAVRRHDHIASCSCWMCGNPRRHLGHRTRQEQRVAHLPLRGGRGRVEDRD